MYQKLHVTALGLNSYSLTGYLKKSMQGRLSPNVGVTRISNVPMSHIRSKNYPTWEYNENKNRFEGQASAFQI